MNHMRNYLRRFYNACCQIRSLSIEELQETGVKLGSHKTEMRVEGMKGRIPSHPTPVLRLWSAVL